MRFSLGIGWPIFLLYFFVSTGLYSQKPNFRFQNYSIEHGLSQSAAFRILQDRRGYIWIGTEQGLNRFDGYNFAVYDYNYDDPNSLSNSYVLSILEDTAGILWVGTNGGGLNKFDTVAHKFTHYFIDPESINSMNNVITAILEDRFGELWVGTAGGGLKKFDREKKTFTNFNVKTVSYSRSSDLNNAGENTINALLEDNTGVLWAGTDEGLSRLDRERKLLVPGGFSGIKTTVIFQDRQGTLWIGTENGFNTFVPSTGEIVHFTIPAGEENRVAANYIRVIFEDRLGVLWIGTDYGLYIFDRKEKVFHSYLQDSKVPYSLISNDVRSIFEDRSGALWIGVYSGGISKLNRTEQSFKHYYPDLAKPGTPDYRMVFEIYEDRDKILWLGTYNGGLVALNRDTGEARSYKNQPNDPESLSDNKIWALSEDREGMIWVGTAGKGLNRFSRKTGKFTRYRHQPGNPNSLCNDTISSIIEDQESNLWIGTNGGLNKLDPQRKNFTLFTANPNNIKTLAHNMIFDMLRDRTGLLWIGTRGGLSIFNPKNNSFTSYRANSKNKETNIFYYPIFAFCEDRQGIIWIGTTSGLLKFEVERGAANFYTENDGLPNNVINGILEDEQGNLWLSTNNGVSKFNPVSGKFNNYGTVDGLQGYEFSGGAYYKSRKGELFFGGMNGFNAFFPASIKDNPYIPPVVITGFQVFNQSVPIGKKVEGRVILGKSISDTEAVTLSYRDYIFSLEFASLSYIYSEKNEYAYMMEGLDKNWNYVGRRRFVTYANLAPGAYTFRVKASNNHGVWNEKGVSLKIKITPPFWTTWWFYLIALLGIISLGVLYFYVRNRSILRRNREVEDMVERRTIDLKESGEKYITVVERAHSGIAIVQDDLVVFRNLSLTKLLGYDEKDITDYSLLQLVAPGKQEEIETLLHQFKISNKLSGNLETILLNKNGRHIDVEINYGNIIYRKHPALLMFFSDIRMQKLLEEERMRTAKLESTRVLVGGIAHDFNNLLAVILGNLEMILLEVPPNTQFRKALLESERTTQKAADLVRGFLALSHGEKPNLSKSYIQCHLKEVVNSALKDTNVTANFDLPLDLWPVDCDILQLKSAFKNIAANSQQAMPDGGVIEVKATNEEFESEQTPNIPPGKYICISITDNGKGVPKDDLPKIFDPYFSTRDNYSQKGLGLGLTVVHSIIKRHEGFIQVDSEVGVGTTVKIYLPVSPSNG